MANRTVVKPPSLSNIDDLESRGLTLPTSPDGATQAGKIPPARRNIKAQYEAVDMNTASARMLERINGQRPPITGGIDTLDSGDSEEEPAAPINTGNIDYVMSDDSLRLPGERDGSLTRPVVPPLPTSAATDVLNQLLAIVEGATHRKQATKPAPDVDPFIGTLGTRDYEPLEEPASPTQTLKSSARASYLSRRSPVGFQVAGGTYSVPAVDVITCGTGLVVLMPIDDNLATFVPGLGAEVVVEFKGDSWECFFPGIHVKLEDLGVYMMSMVYKEDKS